MKLLKMRIKIKHWLQMQTPLQKLYTLAAILGLSLILWFFIWEKKYQSDQLIINQQKQAILTTINTHHQSVKEMQAFLNNPNVNQKQLALRNELRAVTASVDAMIIQLGSAANTLQALRNILIKDSELTLVKLTHTGSALLNTENLTQHKNMSDGSPMAVNNSDLNSNANANNSSVSLKLYRHDFVLELKGAYFGALNYLKKLEQIPGQFYWDSCDYTVQVYPEAKIMLKLHTVNTQEALIDAS